MDFRDVVEIREVVGEDAAQEYLNSIEPNWILLGVAAGQNENHEAYFLYSLGRTAPSVF